MIRLIVLVLLTRINLVFLEGELVVFDVQPEAINWKEVYKYRCSRRYSPGTCIKEVNPVWTYEFQMQNCTERIGCLHAVRSNRFDSYNTCMKKCRRLIDLYAKILSYEQLHHPDALRGKSDIFRREMPSDTLSDYDDQEEGKEKDSEVFNYMYKDLEMASEDKMPVNVDYMVRAFDENYNN